ncbi:GDP-mannose 4,6-dehydratase [Pseudomonas sp. NPDC007930]|uniref:GDP-mannose 4,6-dehydratase n=1 Tax=Pseudomonas sp. NPDC007930 TaxID=3364417 RepID=UPI0036EFD7FC
MAHSQPRVLITGIQGFTGRYMAQEMAAHGYQVFGLSSRGGDGQQVLQADLLDAASLREAVAQVSPQVVIHLAAQAFVGHGDPASFYQVNLIGTRYLLEALASAAQPPRCVLLASSANVYGNAQEGLLDEHSPVQPANDYAVSKLAGEYVAGLFTSRLPLVITRPFNYTGVGQGEQFLLPKIVAHVRQRAELIELGNLDVARDFSDVRAVVAAYRHLVAQCPAGHTVNVSSGQSHTLRQVLALCEALSGHRMEVRVNPAFVRANEVKTLTGDNRKLLGLAPGWSTPPLRDTLQWMLGTDL